VGWAAEGAGAWVAEMRSADADLGSAALDEVRREAEE